MFEEITHIKINKKSGKPISKTAIKSYKDHLNKLAEAGFDTKDSLVKNQEEVIALVDMIVDADDSHARAAKRVWYSSIFYALDEYHLDSKKEYYEAFQKAKDNYAK